jgi:hypothetical protein
VATGAVSTQLFPGGRVLRRLSSVSISNASEEVLKKAIKVLLLTKLDSRQTLVNVNIISATLPGQVLTVIFDVILKEFCSFFAQLSRLTLNG